MPVVGASSKLMVPCTSGSGSLSYLGRLKLDLNVAFFFFSRWRLWGIMKNPRENLWTWDFFWIAHPKRFVGTLRVMFFLIWRTFGPRTCRPANGQPRVLA